MFMCGGHPNPSPSRHANEARNEETIRRSRQAQRVKGGASTPPPPSTPPADDPAPERSSGAVQWTPSGPSSSDVVVPADGRPAEIEVPFGRPASTSMPILGGQRQRQRARAHTLRRTSSTKFHAAEAFNLKLAIAVTNETEVQLRRRRELCHYAAPPLSL